MGQLVPEIGSIDALYDIAKEYESRHGRPPADISHWDPSDSFVDMARRSFVIPLLLEPIRYHFSYQIDRRPELLRALGYPDPDRRILITENGTNAVLAVANVLALLGISKVWMLSPGYFAATHSLRRFGIKVEHIHWQRAGDSFELPRLTIRKGEALWAESPIFNTGVALSSNAVARFDAMMSEGGMVIVDEALSVPPSGLDSLSRQPSYLSIHAPHKAVCVNGLKFGAATFPNALYSLFDQWADIWNGPLSLSALAAIDHFLSPDYERHAHLVSEFAKATDRRFMKALEEFGGQFQTDRASVGYWRTVYAPSLLTSLGEDPKWLSEIVDRTGALFIPGARARSNPAWGFCFRVNLLRGGPLELAALRRLLAELSRQMGAPRP